MCTRPALGRVDGWVVLVQAALASTVGLIVAPSLLGGPARVAPPGIQNEPAAGWLAVGLLAGAWLVALAPSLVRLVGAALASVEQRFRADTPTVASAEGRQLALWFIIFAEIVLIQAVLRPSLVILLGGGLSPDDGEGLLAALTLVPLLLLLNRMHRTARPLVESITRSFLDLFQASTNDDATALASPSLGTAVQPRSVSLDRPSALQTSATNGSSTTNNTPVIGDTSMTNDTSVTNDTSIPNETSMTSDTSLTSEPDSSTFEGSDEEISLATSEVTPLPLDPDATPSGETTVPGGGQ